MAQSVVELMRITQSYLGPSKVLDGINLTLTRGEFLYVLGGTGAGKTSLLKILSTDMRPTEGVIALFGYDLAKASHSTFQAIRRSIGVIPQEIRLLGDLSVRENIVLSLKLAGQTGGRSPESVADEALEKVGLAGRRDALAAHLSGGEAQRVAIARALAREPQLIVADEPTGAQDRDHTWNLMNLLVSASKNGATVVVATHDGEVVRRVRRRCAFLQGGIFRVEGPSP